MFFVIAHQILDPNSIEGFSNGQNVHILGAGPQKVATCRWRMPLKVFRTLFLV